MKKVDWGGEKENEEGVHPNLPRGHHPIEEVRALVE